MSRSHLYRPVTDSSGNIVPNTKVTVYEAGTTQLLLQTMWTTPVGSGQLTNPWTTSDGFVSFYLDRAQTVKVSLTVPGGTETFIDDVSVLPAPENMVRADVAFQVINTPTTGLFLQAGSAGQAAWVDAGNLVNSHPSPLLAIKTYDWSTAFLDDATVVDANQAAVVPTFPDVTADPKPSGWTFTKALRVPTTGIISIKTPAQSFPESGMLIYLYKVVSGNAGVGAAMLHTMIDSDLIAVDTPAVADLCNTWLVGFLDEIPTGSHRITFQHKPSTDTASYVLLGPVWIQAGNNIPAHTHEGIGAQSTRLGVGATADFDGATVAGANARALDQNATAFGLGAQAGGFGVAVGASSNAGVNAVAVGYRAGGSVGKQRFVALGKDALAAADEAIAVGTAAIAQGSAAIALGSGAQTGTSADAVAIGSGAQALGQASVALGHGSLVGATHDFSIAIGPNVTTTATHQAMIGDSSTTLVVPGSLRQVGGDALFGGSASKLGFFGSAGITKPTILGSRGSNATLANLLTVLASMGLITDSSTV